MDERHQRSVDTTISDSKHAKKLRGSQVVNGQPTNVRGGLKPQKMTTTEKL